MYRTELSIRILHALMMISATNISASAQGWDGPKCREVVMTGNEYKFNAHSIDEMIAAIESTDIDHPNGRVVRSPWEMGMIPNLAARKLGYQFQIKMIHAWANHQRMEKYEPYYTALQSVQSVLREDESALSKLPISDSQLDLLVSQPWGDRPELQNVGLIEELGLCAYYAPKKAVGCYQALKKILEDMAPVENITARREIYEVLTEESYRQPLTRLAQEYITLIEKMEQPSKTAVQGAGKKEIGNPGWFGIENRRLDEDLKRVFGGNDLRTWKVLAVLAARGANFYKLYGYATRQNFPVIAALGVISSAALYFDQLTPGGRFSFPRGTKVDCDSGKSYHFWMAAYLSKQYGSRWAAYLSSVAYQMRSDTEFRKPERAFTEKWNSIANQKIRLDLAYSASGAIYGERFQGSKSFNFDIDETLTILENGSEKLTPLSREESVGIWKDSPFMAFLRWNRIFHPEKAFE
jgi:hypothetical protein